MKNLKEFKQRCANDKAIRLTFYKWLTLIFLVLVGCIMIGLDASEKSGNLDKYLSVIQPSMRQAVLIIVTAANIFLSFLLAAYHAMNIAIFKHKS
ncbi:TPA: hypothetical protein ACGIK9_003356 [Acinetobacter baumannii]|uniref:hypothetical protein n=1 Tax=Acinetobacter baumannii TaxID=470 RepID=UPI00338D740D